MERKEIKKKDEGDRKKKRQTDFLEFDLAPRFQSWSSAAAFFAFSAATLALAASAFCRAHLSEKQQDLVDWFLFVCRVEGEEVSGGRGRRGAEGKG